jgi:uncharacterized phage protein (TIGR01671 family)
MNYAFATDAHGNMLEKQGGEWVEPCGADRLTVLRSTGFNDSEGAEIFEGDVVEHSWDKVRHVIAYGRYSVGSHDCADPLGFFLKRDEGSLSGVAWGEDLYPHCVRVLGNVFESPELLDFDFDGEL